jgi:hypothetical protein
MGRVKLVKMAFTPSHYGLDEVFLCGWRKKYQILPRPTGQREHGSECHLKKRPQLLSTALQDSAII